MLYSDLSYQKDHNCQSKIRDTIYQNPGHAVMSAMFILFGLPKTMLIGTNYSTEVHSRKPEINKFSTT
ncbi:hypothetical protein DPMN_092515 [Dreissena polymorpha]|uniref:Uncharacterized protein n=1 Tax=Dreissena polymorpha TaxID=45954 RepID=A0A9D4R083_DREPO|nr:hypothetical protein DPMN_092515 [Dreissena polymorpha]